MTLQELLASKFPFLRLAKEYSDALIARHSKNAESYSQCGEDVMVAKLLGDRFSKDSIYIEVGGNHPSRFSNTYKFYRAGYNGIVIEPNDFYKKLYRWVRPRDTLIQIGCGKAARVLEFIHHPRKAYSGFTDGKVEGDFRREYLPVFPLDELIGLLDGRRVALLSIDVEGMDYEVLEGGEQMIKDHVDVIVVEYGDRLDDITNFLKGLGFDLKQKTHYNVILEKSRTSQLKAARSQDVVDTPQISTSRL